MPIFAGEKQILNVLMNILPMARIWSLCVVHITHHL